jgi:catechol 2,3-dioxygenase-like lactoylglutathione lyase family enzyme
MTELRKVRSIFHININCSDLGKSIAFYEKLGFHRSMDLEGFKGDADDSYETLGVSGRVEHKGPTVMFLGDDPRQTRLDLMQWIEPKPAPSQRLRPEQVGVPRICLWAKDLIGLYDELTAQGMKFLTAPAGPFPDRAIKTIVALHDPDGLIIELMEFMPHGKDLYESK